LEQAQQAVERLESDWNKDKYVDEASASYKSDAGDTFQIRNACSSTA
jgi:hypothetical protein